jgi:hypothetical protein
MVALVAMVLTLVVVGALVTWVLSGELRKGPGLDVVAEEGPPVDGPTTLAYAIPDGQDPAVLSVALSREGFGSVPVRRGVFERLLVECPCPADRDRVRSIIEHVRRTRLGGAEIVVTHVRFDDELP